MKSVIIKQTGAFAKRLVLAPYFFSMCVYECACVFVMHATSFPCYRSDADITSRPYQSIWSKRASALQSVPYKSKYLISLSDFTQAAPVLSASPGLLKCSHHQVLFSQYLFAPCSVILCQKYPNNVYCQNQQYRSFRSATAWWKDESKVEKTVKALKGSASEDEVVPTKTESAVAPKKTLWQRFVAFCIHYYHGFRLLAIDMKISSKLLWQLLRGKSLTRREHNQLVRTTADMFRLVPLLVVIIVPFAEFLLPFALILFPNILPSTFQDPNDEKKKRKKTLKAKLEMAKFLQKTVQESAVEADKHEGQTVESFAQFMDKIRKEGTKPRTKDIMKFAKLFEDEITLDNLTRSQLRACCIILNVTPIGSDALLRFLLQMKLRRLRADDKVIQREGVESLSISELQAANRARGMNALGVSEERLRAQLKQWLRLHLEEKIPTSLLLLSRALYIPDNLSTEEKLGATITQLPETAAVEAKLKAAEMSGETVDNKTRLEIIKHEEAIIAAEKEELAKEIKLLEEQTVKDVTDFRAADNAREAQLKMVDKAKPLETPPSEILVDRAKVLQPSDGESIKQEESAKITAKDLDDMETVLEEIAKERGLNIEKDALKGLKHEVSEYKEDLEDLKVVANGDKKKHFQESPAARHLAKKVDSMIARLDTVMADLEEDKTSVQQQMSKEKQILDKEHIGAVQRSQEKIDKYKSNIISVNELIVALKRLKKVPSESKLQQIFQALDHDKDGNIHINDALQVLEHLSQEHLKLSPAQMEEVLTVLKHEAQLEDEERQKEKEQKEGILSERKQ
ncbi:unnamed protein product [Candidula unifasciata]|uniref:Mitochondrial proton/calcium exchanger protein n=1 Tax=Candidula unifasciata TaxID=100452 RepID=A0A8S3ZPY4_9EUPU|nr:unnamed protein product [Candidula unifasciata]